MARAGTVDPMSFGFAVSFEDRVSQGANSAKRAINSLLRAITKLQQTTTAPPAGLDQWAAGIDRIASASSSGAAGSRRLSSALNHLNRGFTSAGTSARRAGDGFDTMARAFIGANVAIVTSKMWRGLETLGAGFMSALKEGAQFGREMTLVGSLVEDSAGNMDRLRAMALKMGSSTQFSATEAAQAMTVLGQQGDKTAAVLGKLPHVLNLATAGSLNTEQAAQFLSDAMAQFKNEAMSAEQVVNMLAAGFNVGKFSATGLQTALRQSAAVAGTLGVSMKDTVATLNLFKEAGYDASQSGTIFRNILLGVAKGGTKFDAVLARFSINREDLKKSLKDPGQLLQKLMPVLNDAGAAAELFGVRSGPGLLAALRQGLPGLNEFRRKIEAATSAADLAERLNDTVAGQMKIFQNNIKNMGITLSAEVEKFSLPFLKMANNVLTNVLPVFKTFFRILVQDAGNFVSRLFGKLGEWSGFLKTLVLKNTTETKDAIREVQQQLVVRFVLAAAVVSKFFEGFKNGFMKAWGVISDVWTKISGFFDQIRSFFGMDEVKKGSKFNAKDLGEAVGYWTTMAAAVGGVMFLASLFSLLFGGWVKLMIVGAVLVISKWEPIRDFFLSLFDVFGAFEAIFGKPLEETKLGQFLGLESGRVTEGEVLAKRVEIRRAIQAGLLQKPGVTGTPLIGGAEGTMFSAEEVASLPGGTTTAPALRTVTPAEQQGSVGANVVNNNAAPVTINVNEGAFQAMAADWEGVSRKVLPVLEGAMRAAQRRGEGAQ